KNPDDDKVNCWPPSTIGILEREVGSTKYAAKWQTEISRGECDTEPRTEAAKFFERTDSYWVQFPVRFSGTGNQQADIHVLRLKSSNEWVAIDSKSWEKDLEGKVPESYAIWKGLYFSPANLEFATPTWGKGDANCCPSGPDIKGHLELVGHRLQLKSI